MEKKVRGPRLTRAALQDQYGFNTAFSRGLGPRRDLSIGSKERGHQALHGRLRE